MSRTVGRRGVFGVVRPGRMLLALGAVALPLGLAACGGDDSTAAAVDKGTIVSVQVGESGETYFVTPDQTTVDAGTVTFAVTNVGELYHEFIVYSNPDGVAAGEIAIDDENEADLVEESIIGEAPYATPPIVPATKQPGDADHRIRSGGWGAELTVDLAAGDYILLCNLSGHYGAAKQYMEFTVT